ncbi:MAG: hypothetical protein II956_07555 [Bacteroidales bacterium]|nr:hypothetical protein [Bacteroidales bacterium]
MIPLLHTIKEIDRAFSTGDVPVLVTCSDQKQYICKYMRADSVSAYKLASELFGSLLAKYWNLNTPEFVFVKILPEHTKQFAIPCNFNVEAVGYQKIENAADITNCIDGARDIFNVFDALKIPKEWNVSENILRNKISELFENQWIDGCFSNFVETLRQNF